MNFIEENLRYKFDLIGSEVQSGVYVESSNRHGYHSKDTVQRSTSVSDPMRVNNS